MKAKVTFKLKAVEPSEADILKACLKALEYHPQVAWAYRMNTGAAYAVRVDGPPRFIKFGFEGCPDIIGQLKDGTIIVVETKSNKGKLTQAQKTFLEMVSENGGFSACVRGADELVKLLNEFLAR